MQTSERRAEDASPVQSRLGIAGTALTGAFLYAVLVGGTGSGELDPVLRTLNAAVAAALLIEYVIGAPRRVDHLDRSILVAVLLVAVAGVLSAFPRQSFDAVLAAMTYAAALFLARGQLSREPMRRAFVTACIGLSLVFTVGAALVWAPLVFEWWTLAGREVLPPLDIHLSGGPWGHRYDVGLLVMLLYPAWWIGRPSAARRALAVITGIVALLVVGITGSRTLWAAAILATVVLGLPAVARLWSRYPRVRVPAMAAVTIVAAVAFLAGASTPLIDRALNFASLDWRIAMWSSLMELWLERPLAGVGPGTFPLALPLTDYFDTRSWAPRHPDNAIVQVLAEGGLLGLAALLLAGVSVVWAVLRGRSLAARWVSIVFLIACLGANPTDFAFLVVVGIAWAAYASPRVGVEPAPSAGRAPLLVPILAALTLVALAHASTMGAGFFYQSARTAVQRSDLEAAGTALAVASTLDPGMALYHRTRGTLAALGGDVDGAVKHLERAVELNRGDDLAWRTLAIVREASGGSAAEAIGRAADAQRSDPTNLLFAAEAAREAGDSAEVQALLAEVVHAWPAVVAAPGWDALLPAGVTTSDILDRAGDRAARGQPMPELLTTQDLWLGVLAERPDLHASAVDRLRDEDLPNLLAGAIACDDASDAIDRLPASAHRSALYWEIRIRTSALTGDLDLDAVQAYQIMTGGSYRPEAADTVLNPLNENSEYSADRWGYRRYPISWPLITPGIPSPHAGSMRWMFDPRGAVEMAGLGDRLEAC